ncbi:MAG: Gfo/Idh/MocA family oxidoreductase, partial [Bacilli bacterium]
MFNIGIIGAGRIGKVHAQSINLYVKQACVKSIYNYELDEETLEWANANGISEVYDDYQKILNDPLIDAVLICTSTNTHAQISIEALQANKHVFCEKPIDHRVSRINEVNDVLKKTNLKYQVGFNRRFDNEFMALKEAIDAQEAGAIQLVKITSRDPLPPPLSYIEVSGGLFLDMSIHDFDMVSYLCESEVV